ncbi:MFS transporter [Algoriphagus aestuariicola]|uniref:MFS transporter n=1 Tax=Algoriphagus aestuariicola TaxID=1852016 RepID=A0ABS3BLT8_9BACT|nr:MFS transporter [Algoriphagus aestuariicola]MBN7800262.1 MFS transporter [Algoriphagus aestuariicola]
MKQEFPLKSGFRINQINIMISGISHTIEEEIPMKAFWKAIWAIALGVASLIIAEFLPVSLLTPLANDLGITEGLAGQTISATADAALISSCLITPITRRLDRRWVLLSFCVLQIVSCLIVYFSPNFPLLLIGRVLLGIGIGGFWAMSAATAMRLVPAESIPKALSIIFGAVSIATVIAAPMGSFLGAHMSWRYVFLITGGMGLIAFDKHNSKSDNQP